MIVLLLLLLLLKLHTSPDAYLLGGGPAEELGAGEVVVREVDDSRRGGQEGPVVDVAEVVLAEVGQRDARRLREEEGAQRLQVVVVGAEDPVGRECCVSESGTWCFTPSQPLRLFRGDIQCQ